MEVGAWSLLSNLDSQTRAATISACGTIVAATIAAIVVFVQIGRQARKARENIRHTEEIKLKLQIYEKALAACKEAEDARAQLVGYLQRFMFSLSNAQVTQREGGNLLVPEQRYAEYSRLSSDAQMKAIGIITWVEEWRLVDPRVEIFQTAIGAVGFDIREATAKFFEASMRVFPAPMPNDSTKLFPWAPPSKEVFEALQQRFDELQGRYLTLSGYLMDFQREMQTLLLGPLFPRNKISARRPLDPSVKVIGMEKRTELSKFFHDETPWGKNKSEIENSVAAEHRKPRD